MSIINNGLAVELFHYLSENIMQTPFYKTYGISLLELGLGYSVFEITNKEATNSSGFIHGGIQMTCADTAMGNAVRTYGYKTATIEQSSTFLRPTKSNSRIICVGKVMEIGESIFYTVGKLYSDDVLVMQNTATYFNLGKEKMIKKELDQSGQ